MEAYAVVESGGKQHMVSKNQVLEVERLDAEVDGTVELGPVLAVSDGRELNVGFPECTGHKVTARVLEHFRASKVVAYKKKRRKGYHRKIGHRQEQTRVRILDIE